jgi:hypothetical protein
MPMLWYVIWWALFGQTRFSEIDRQSQHRDLDLFPLFLIVSRAVVRLVKAVNERERPATWDYPPSLPTGFRAQTFWLSKYAKGIETMGCITLSTFGDLLHYPFFFMGPCD